MLVVVPMFALEAGGGRFARSGTSRAEVSERNAGQITRPQTIQIAAFRGSECARCWPYPELADKVVDGELGIAAGRNRA